LVLAKLLRGGAADTAGETHVSRVGTANPALALGIPLSRKGVAMLAACSLGIRDSGVFAG